MNVCFILTIFRIIFDRSTIKSFCSIPVIDVITPFNDAYARRIFPRQIGYTDSLLKFRWAIPLMHISLNGSYVDFDAAVFEGCIVLPPRI